MHTIPAGQTITFKATFADDAPYEGLALIQVDDPGGWLTIDTLGPHQREYTTPVSDEDMTYRAIPRPGSETPVEITAAFNED